MNFSGLNILSIQKRYDRTHFRVSWLRKYLKHFKQSITHVNTTQWRQWTEETIMHKQKCDISAVVAVKRNNNYFPDTSRSWCPRKIMTKIPAIMHYFTLIKGFRKSYLQLRETRIFQQDLVIPSPQHNRQALEDLLVQVLIFLALLYRLENMNQKH